MSLDAFQCAAVDLTLDYRKARAVRDGDPAVLAGYELTDRERSRLVAIVGQPMMSVHCSLSRGNRVEIIGGAFPMTCFLLDGQFGDVLDELWRDHRPSNYQLRGEETAFADLLRRKLRRGDVCIPYLGEVFDYECLCGELMGRARASSQAVEAIMAFEHHPADLLPPLSRLTAPPPDLPRGRYPAVVRLRNDAFDVLPA
jgi:hypothetical protein